MKNDSLEKHLAWLETPDCTCEHAVQGLGRLYGVSMGEGWVRLNEAEDCPYHNAEGRARHEARRLETLTGREPRCETCHAPHAVSNGLHHPIPAHEPCERCRDHRFAMPVASAS